MDPGDSLPLLCAIRGRLGHHQHGHTLRRVSRSNACAQTMAESTPATPSPNSLESKAQSVDSLRTAHHSITVLRNCSTTDLSSTSMHFSYSPVICLIGSCMQKAAKVGRLGNQTPKLLAYQT